MTNKPQEQVIILLIFDQKWPKKKGPGLNLFLPEVSLRRTGVHHAV